MFLENSAEKVFGKESGSLTITLILIEFMNNMFRECLLKKIERVFDLY